MAAAAVAQEAGSAGVCQERAPPLTFRPARGSRLTYRSPPRGAVRPSSEIVVVEARWRYAHLTLVDAPARGQESRKRGDAVALNSPKCPVSSSTSRHAPSGTQRRDE